MHTNVVYVDFAAVRQTEVAHEPGRAVAARDIGAQAQVLVSRAQSARATSDGLTQAIGDLGEASATTRAQTTRLREAMVELDRANEKLADLHARARAIAGVEI